MEVMETRWLLQPCYSVVSALLTPRHKVGQFMHANHQSAQRAIRVAVNPWLLPLLADRYM